MSVAQGAYSKCTAGELANAFCGSVHCALEVNIGPLAANCSCAAHFTSSPAANIVFNISAWQCVAASWGVEQSII